MPELTDFCWKGNSFVDTLCLCVYKEVIKSFCFIMLTMVWWCLFLTLIFSTAAGSQVGKKRSKPSSKYKFLNCVMILLWYIKLYFIWLAQRTSMNSMIKYGLCLKATTRESKWKKDQKTAWILLADCLACCPPATPPK